MREAPIETERSGQFRSLFEDPATLRSWYETSLPKVYSFVFARCGGIEAVAQDITQETFVEVVRRRSSFDGRSDPLTWVVGIAKHKVADHYRRAYREQRRQLELVAEQEIESAPNDAMDKIASRDAVISALHRLPESQRVVMALHYLDGHSVKEIAKTLGRSASAVESLLARGRERFKRAYIKQGESI